MSYDAPHAIQHTPQEDPIWAGLRFIPLSMPGSHGMKTPVTVQPQNC
jgi:hypothetical protein